MATKKTAYEAPTPASDKKKALQTALAQIDKSFGKGTVMRLGDRPEMNIEAIPTGSLALDAALGIGGVPNAVGVLLREKTDLGIHTEMFTDSMVDLIECGAVTNMKKPIHVGKTIATLAMGSKKMYDFMVFV